MIKTLDLSKIRVKRNSALSEFEEALGVVLKFLRMCIEKNEFPVRVLRAVKKFRIIFTILLF